MKSSAGTPPFSLFRCPIILLIISLPNCINYIIRFSQLYYTINTVECQLIFAHLNALTYSYAVNAFFRLRQTNRAKLLFSSFFALLLPPFTTSYRPNRARKRFSSIVLPHSPFSPTGYYKKEIPQHK